jgi:hypothetical protein
LFQHGTRLSFGLDFLAVEQGKAARCRSRQRDEDAGTAMPKDAQCLHANFPIQKMG